MVIHSPDVSVIVPTYCEVENLLILLPQIDQAMVSDGLSYEVIVVDDNSLDGTVKVCQQLAQSFPIHLKTRQNERGLASAVICGLRAAKGQVLVVMDADLSHPPDAIPQLVTECQSPFVDFSIGSRYVEGGSIDSNWTRFRRMNSRVASWLACGLTSAKDPMSGFFAVKRTTFESAKYMHPLGYKIGLEILIRCDCSRVVEIPINFQDRTRGNSKLTLGQQWLYMRHLGRLYPAKYVGISRITRFGIVGLSGMIIDLVALALLRPAVSLTLARAVAIWIAMTWNYFLHRGYTFQKPVADSTVNQYGKFVGACLMGASTNWLVSLVATLAMPMFSGQVFVASAMGVIAGAVINYTMCQRMVFGQSASIEEPQIIPLTTQEELKIQVPDLVQPAQAQQKMAA
ncbi:MAG: glycosyltransferase family 2 protein [Pirellulales bacterium]